MGYEYDVRVCIECHKNITENDRVSLAVCQEAKHQVIYSGCLVFTVLCFFYNIVHIFRN